MRTRAISDDELHRWLEALHAEQVAGRYVAGLTNLFIRDWRPA